MGFTVVDTRVPGGTEFGERARQQLFQTLNDLLMVSYIGAETLSHGYIELWLQAQESVVKEVILPSLKNREMVLCDRFSDSALAFFGYGAKRDLTELKNFILQASSGLVPDLTLWFDVPLEVGLARKGHIYNPKTIGYYREVEKGYKILYSENQESNWRRVDATFPLDIVESEAWQIIVEELNKRG